MSNQKTLLIITDGISNSEYKCLTKSNKYFKNWKIVSIRYSDLLYFYNFFSINTTLSDEISNTFSLFYNNKKNYSGDYEYIFRNNYLDFQFNEIQCEITSSLNLADVFKNFLDLLQPSVIIIGHDAFTRERLLVNIAKKQGVITLGLLHSGLGFKCAFRGIVGDVDYVLVWNKIDKKFIMDYGVLENHIVIIGSLAYEFLEPKYHNNKIFNLSARKRKRKKILIITAAINSGFSGLIASQTEHIKIFNDLILYIQRRKDLEFVIKTHPSFDHYELYRQLKNFNLTNYIFDESLDLKSAIKNSDTCILLNYFTTATLDVLINNVPVIFLENAVYQLNDWCTNDIYSVIPKVKNVNELESIIDKVNNDLNFRKHVLEKSKLLLKSIIHEVENVPSKNLFLFLDSLQQTKNESNTKNTIYPLNYFVYGVSNLELPQCFNYKLFRVNRNSEDTQYSTLLKLYILGSNSGNSLASFKSLIYLFILLIYNFDLLFKFKNFNNREVLKFFYRQINRLNLF